MFFEAVWDFVVTIANDENQEVIFGQIVGLVGSEAIVVVDEATERVLQLYLILVVHGYTDGECWITLSDATTGPDFREKRCFLDVSDFAVGSEACTPDLAIELRLRQHHRLVGRLRPWLPLDLLEVCASV